MFNYEDILARLQNGETSESIADEMAKALNDAQAQLKEIQANEEKAQREADKRTHMQDIVNSMVEWVKTYYPEVETNETDLDADTVIELFESFKNISDMFKNFDSIAKVQEPKTKTKPVIKISTPKDSDDIINNFLKQMGW